jgi:hypothetical protein
MALTEEDLKRMDEVIEKEAEANAEIKALLTTFKTVPKEIEVFGIKLKVLPTIPRKLRKEISKFESIADDMEATEQHTYTILSKVCTDDPFNKPETWEYLDEKTGMVPELMRTIFNEAYEVEKKLKKFR